MTAWDRLWAKTTLVGDCWVSALGICRGGYSQVRVAGQLRMAHVLAWEALNGPVPDGLELDHLCGREACWNPRHSEAVPHVVNVRRGGNANRAKTACPKGHAYTRTSRGRRACRTCDRERTP